MGFQLTEWEFSSTVAKADTPLSAGTHHLYIEEAQYLPDNMTYTIRVRSLDTDEVSAVKYFIQNTDLSINNRAVGTLNTLKKALFGVADGIAAPPDIIHGIVMAEVVMSKPKVYNGEMRQYPQIYEYKPVPRTYYETVAESGLELIEQYVEG